MKLFSYLKRTFSQENIDRTISGGIWPQVKLLLIAILLVLASFSVFVIFSSIRLGEAQEWDQVLWMVYNNFVDAGNQITEVSWSNRILVGIISLFGSVLMGGVLISTVSNIIERRVEAVRQGRVTYRKIKGHYVIIGYGEITISLIKELFSYTNSTELPAIILMTKQEAENVRRSLQSQLNKNEEENVKIYFGNIESIEELERLNIPQVKEVYILGEQEEYGRDSKNIECVRYISELRGSKQKELLHVFVQFDRIPSYSNIQKLTLPTEYFMQEGKQNILFRPFNFHENWARKLWSFYADNSCYEPLDYRPIQVIKEKGHYIAGSEDFVHLVIVGFNRMGRALLLEALRICHFANYDDSIPSEKRIRTHITIVDKELDSQKDYFQAQFPYIDKQIEDVIIEYRNQDICHPKLRKEMEDWSNDSHRMLTIAVCLKDPDMSLSIGLNLPTDIYKNEIPVLIRQELQNGLGKLINQDKDGRYKKVKVFGMLNQGIQKSLLDDTLSMYIHQYYRCQYCNCKSYDECPYYMKQFCKQNKTCAINYVQNIYKFRNSPTESEELKSMAETSWNGLQEIYKWANRYQIDAYEIYCRTLGLKIKKDNNKISETILSTDSEQLYFLMRMEKYRWNAERSIAGWQYKEGEKDNKHFTHPLLMAFHELEKRDASQIFKDKDVIDNLPYLLAIEEQTK